MPNPDGTSTREELWARLKEEGRLDEFIAYQQKLQKKPFLFPAFKSMNAAVLRFPPLLSSTEEVLQKADQLRKEDDEAIEQFNIPASEKIARANHMRAVKMAKEKEERERRKLVNSQIEELSIRTKDDDIDYDRDLDWVYKNMGRVKVPPLDAPSVSAYRLYEVARENPGDFVKKFSERQKEIRKDKSGSDERERSADEREKTRALDRLMKEVTPDIAALVEDAIRLHPEVVIQVMKASGYYVRQRTVDGVSNEAV